MRATTLEEILISSGVLTTAVSKHQAMNIPAFTACVELISSTVASLPIKLFEEKDEEMKDEVDDPRVDLLNSDTGDLLDGFQWKKAMVEDFLIEGAGYSYIKRSRNDAKSIHFVSNKSVTINKNTDPIEKRADIMVNGAPYREFEFIKLLRKTKDGVTGKGILKENNVMLSVAYNEMIFEEVLVKTGGNKRGFLKAANRLSKEAMDELKAGWKKLYANNDENVLVLNNGVEFAEASQTSVEMQLNEHKRTNSDEICKIFLVSPEILSGKAKEEEYHNWIKVCILPVLSAFEAALNKDFLLPSEKENRFFAFDTHELTKGNVRERYQAYELGIKNGVLQIDEARHKENLPPLGLKFLKLGLQDVLYFADSQEIYTPNTNKLAKMGENPTVDPNTPNAQNGTPNAPNGGQANVDNQGISNNSGPNPQPNNQSNNPNQGK
jgi:HK97 family phage portal protein